MRTTQWQLSFEGLVLSQESHAWDAGIQFAQHEDYFNFQQAGTRRPVRARPLRAASTEQRFGRIVLTPAGFSIPVETLGIEVDFPVRKFEFDAHWLNAQLPASLNFDFRKAYAQPVFDEPIIAFTLDRIYDEFLLSRRDRGPMLKSLMHILAIDTARCLIARSSQIEISRGGLTPDQVAQIRHLIQTTEFKHLTPSYIAEKCGMRLVRLRETFRHATGHSLRAEIEEARVSAACRQLVETHQPLKVLAHHMGFTHTSAFCYWFKQSTGLTPTEYRVRHVISSAGNC